LPPRPPRMNPGPIPAPTPTPRPAPIQGPAPTPTPSPSPAPTPPPAAPPTAVPKQPKHRANTTKHHPKARHVVARTKPIFQRHGHGKPSAIHTASSDLA
jgi:hypothetical protein